MGDRQIISMNDVPAAALAALRRQPGTSAEVHLVLEEDEYETKFGDGRFLVARAAFLDRAAAARFLDGLGKRRMTAWHLKTIVVVRDEAGTQVAADLTGIASSLKDVVALLV